MAATSAQLPSTEDDEAWLYGDENKAPKNDDSSTRVTENGNTNENKSAGESMEIGKEPGKKDDKEEGEMSGEEKEEEDDSDDDDDDVQVTIGDIKTWTATETPRNLFKGGTAYQKSGTGATSAPKSAAGKGLDIEAQGTINGVPVYEFDLSSLKTEDKPWNKPGADITDYFNYGFTEETWELYCEKHNRLRAENHAPLGPKTSSHSSGGTRDKRDKDSNQIGSSIPTTSQVAKRHSSGAPARKMSGTIDVIGSTARSSRRPGDHESADDYRKYNQTTSVPPPGVPDYSMPPPGMPPPNVPPPGVPPAGVPPPPGVAITGASYVGTDPYDPYYGTVTADRTQPPPSFTVPTYNYDTPHNSYGVTYTEPHHPSWESGYEERWRHRELSPETDLYSRERDAYRRDRDRDRDRERERDRESHRERGRDRERDRDRRDRSRSGDRDSSKHRTRRKKEDELDHHKSKHRSKSKKKRDKDDPDASQPDDNESKD